ncbi:MAG: hypothetical protein CBD60_00320 [Flavobacteriaceae bacterium TMED200]|nr:hypothetical protein [Flavobacteriaceae bacterium]OUW67030.1 MAG: hypothetical protein CBD60_00320 [Flavobacteriaceae bacterium TMED200]|tara:strand:+ start:2531 stop:3211 length:681 start_codon:yes stop_codon:yes gene_type:complete
MKKLLLLFSLFISFTIFSQNIYWLDVTIDVDGGNASSVAELVTAYYSSIKIPEDVSVSFSSIAMKGNSFKGTHILSMFSQSAKSLADFRASLKGPKWDLYISKMGKYVNSARRGAGVGLLNFNLDKPQPIGQAWIFKVKNQPSFVASFGKLMKSTKTPGLVSMGQIVHGSDNGENMYIYLTYPDLESAFKFGPDSKKEQEAFATFQKEISSADYSQTFTRVLIKQF